MHSHSSSHKPPFTAQCKACVWTDGCWNLLCAFAFLPLMFLQSIPNPDASCHVLVYIYIYLYIYTHSRLKQKARTERRILNTNRAGFVFLRRNEMF